MSHFTVLVIGDNVDEQLAPFHEFECTGHNDQYVQAVDVHAEARGDYERITVQRLRAPDGSLHEPHDDQFYRDPTPAEARQLQQAGPLGRVPGLKTTSKDWGDGQGYRPKVYAAPAGYVEVEVPIRDVMTFGEYLEDWEGRKRLGPTDTPDIEGEHKFGWFRTDAAGEVVEVVRRTNPNAHWDWYVVGGRWTGFFQLKAGTRGTCGSPGLGTAPAPAGHADQARKGDIDWDGMRDAAEQAAATRYDQVHAVFAGRTVHPWAVVRDKHLDDNEARRFYHDQAPIRDLRATGGELAWADADEFLVPRDTYLARARAKSCCTFAVVKDGVWSERGRMGWFGCVADEQDPEAWELEVAALIDSLPDDTLLTVVDCHI